MTRPLSDATPGPFTAALDRFDPSAEPYANMTPRRLKEVKDRLLAQQDLPAFWEADLHLAEKTPSPERYAHELGVFVHARLLIMEDQGGLPYQGWTHRHLIATWYTLMQIVLERWTPETFPPWDPTEIRQRADDEGARMADVIAKRPELMEELQASLEEENGGPLVAPEVEPW